MNNLTLSKKEKKENDQNVNHLGACNASCHGSTYILHDKTYQQCQSSPYGTKSNQITQIKDSCQLRLRRILETSIFSPKKQNKEQISICFLIGMFYIGWNYNDQA